MYFVSLSASLQIYQWSETFNKDIFVEIAFFEKGDVG